MIKIKRGLNIPITGEPENTIKETIKTKEVAVLGSDYPGLKPKMLVKEGDVVKAGQPLFEDKNNVGVLFTAPASGKVIAINRGEKRVLQSVVIAVDGDTQIEVDSYSEGELTSLKPDDIRKNLQKSGQWVGLRTRPYSKVAPIDQKAEAIFITAMDTNPLALNPKDVINQHLNDFKNGLKVLSRLTAGKVYVCHAPDFDASNIDMNCENVKFETFSGPHPAGLAGTHIHYLSPVHSSKAVWYTNYQEVIGFGHLFTTGKIWKERVISLGGPLVKDPALYRVPLGGDLRTIYQDRLSSADYRIVSGSLLNGHNAKEPLNYLGRYHLQVSVLQEGGERELLGWHMPGFNKFSIKNIFASKIFGSKKRFAISSTQSGSLRAMVPVLSYEKVLPIDTEPTFLLRSLLTQDTDMAQALGALELDEEDLALCTFVCPCKIDYGPLLRQCLTTIEKEG